MQKIFSLQIGLFNFIYRGLKIKILKKIKKHIIYKVLTKNNYNIHKWDPSATEIFMTQCFSDWGNEYLFLDSVKGRNNSYFLDIGCHSGYYPILFKNYFDNTIGFEPSSKCINILKLINIEKFTYHQCFVGKENNYVEAKENDAGYSFYNNTNHEFKINKKLEQITLDSFCNKKNIENVTAIKIDVDGIDMEVLYGAKEVIKKNRPSVMIENYSEELFNYFKELDYSLLTLSSSKAKPYNLCLEELKSYDEKKWTKMVCCIPNEFKKKYQYNTFKGNFITGINKKKIIENFKI
tara:strand:+ start:387 stop:1265 length:879 start_codon:yes stop_codon:yes gene_type:complete